MKRLKTEQKSKLLNEFVITEREIKLLNKCAISEHQR